MKSIVKRLGRLVTYAGGDPIPGPTSDMIREIIADIEDEKRKRDALDAKIRAHIEDAYAANESESLEQALTLLNGGVR